MGGWAFEVRSCGAGFGARQVSFVMLTTWQSALPVHLSHFSPSRRGCVLCLLSLHIFCFCGSLCISCFLSNTFHKLLAAGWSFCFPGSFVSPESLLSSGDAGAPKWGIRWRDMHALFALWPLRLLTRWPLDFDSGISQGLPCQQADEIKLHTTHAFYAAPCKCAVVCVCNNIIKLHSPTALWLMTKDPTLLWLLWKAASLVCWPDSL